VIKDPSQSNSHENTYDVIRRALRSEKLTDMKRHAKAKLMSGPNGAVHDRNP